MIYKEQARYDEAEKLLLEAIEGRRLKLGDTHPHTQQSLNNLIDLYEAWNKPEKAEKWRAKLPQTEATIERHINTKIAPFSLAKLIQPSCNPKPPYLPIPRKS
jgi:tetratricopeptide (TPR) repeat protein